MGDKNTIFLIHGRGEKRDTYWLNWLEKELKRGGRHAIYPSFPNPDRPIMTTWYQEFKQYQAEFKENSIVVARSLGSIFAFYLLGRSKTRIAKTILVAPPAAKKRSLKEIQADVQLRLAGSENPSYMETFKKDLKYIKAFVEQNFCWETIKSRSKNFVFYFSTNDHHVPFRETVKFYSQIFKNAAINKLINHGHVNEKSGVFTLPLVLREIINLTP